jgi:hypothetical protein
VTKKYDAFISYSTERDDKMAAALEAKLTRYAVPWYKPSKVRIFRDKTALTASALEPALHRAPGAVNTADRPCVARGRQVGLGEPGDRLVAVE